MGRRMLQNSANVFLKTPGDFNVQPEWTTD
jgi:hypothetical protein